MNSLHYQSRGPVDAKPVVFLHGFLGCSEDWAETAESLVDSYHCILVDLPGHGKSVGYSDVGIYSFEGAGAAICSLMEELQLSDPVLVGYSMGGRLAVSLAVTTRKFSAAVITSASPGLPTEEERQARRTSDQVLAESLLSLPLPRFLRDWYSGPLFEDLARREDLLDRMVERRSHNDPHELASALRGMSLGAQPSYSELLAGVTIPMMFVAGKRDSRYVEIAEKMAANVPRARLEVMPNCGHALHLQCPLAYADSLRAFMRSFD